MVQLKEYLFVLTEVRLLESKAITAFPIGLISVDEHVSLPCGEEGTPSTIGELGSYGVELPIVIDLKFYRDTSLWAASCINDLYIDLAGVSIVVDDIDFGIGRRAANDLLWPVIATEGLGMYEHGTRDGSIEPR